jgi:hypothetical protein
MKIILEIVSNSYVRLSLAEGKKIKDRISWRENNSLSRKLLVKIDQILRRNKIGLDKISGCEIISEVPKNWTSHRIAKSAFESLAIAKKFQP